MSVRSLSHEVEGRAAVTEAEESRGPRTAMGMLVSGCYLRTEASKKLDPDPCLQKAVIGNSEVLCITESYKRGLNVFKVKKQLMFRKYV